MAHLVASAPAPLEYVEMLLCREFGVLPSVLRQENAGDIMRMLNMMTQEGKARKILDGRHG